MRSAVLAIFTTTLVASAGCENASQLDRKAGTTSAGMSAQIASPARSVDHVAKLELFVMSKCPYGVEVEKAISPVLAKLGGNLEFHLAFIGQQQNGQLVSMHGPAEIAGDIAQLCARDVSPDQYMRLIDCQNRDPGHVDTNWETCGKQLNIDTGAIKACIDGGKGKELLAASFGEAQQRGATGSPTIYLNGKPYGGGRRTKDFTRAVCETFDGAKPAECNNLPTPVAVNAVFFSDARCKKCNIDQLEGRLKQMFDGLVVKKVDYMTPAGKELYAQLRQADSSFKALPAILFDKSIEGDKDGKQQIGRYLHQIGEYQAVALGGSFDPTAEICDNKIDDDGNGKTDCDDSACKDAMVCRPEIKKSLDLFVMSHCPYGTKAILAAKEFADAFGKDATVNVHFIGDMKNGEPTSMHGPEEVADDLREACAIQHYGKDQKAMEFLACRSKDLRADWKACTGASGVEADVIDKCVAGDEGKKLLASSFELAAKLDIHSSPTFLLNNRETFNAQDAANIEASFCRGNPGLPGCEKKLSSAPQQANGAAACGN